MPAGHTPFNATSTAADVVEGIDLTGIASVDAFVAAWEGPLHVLVNHARGTTP